MKPIYQYSGQGRRSRVYNLISPAAAAWLFERDDSVLRKLAIAGTIHSATVSGWGGKDSRFYSFDALCRRYGTPDANRLTFLRVFGCMYGPGMGDLDGAATLLLVLPPRVQSLGDVPESSIVLAADEAGHVAIHKEPES